MTKKEKQSRLKNFNQMGIYSRKTINDFLIVSNAQGIHIRPAVNIYLLVKKYPKTNVIFLLRNRVARASNLNEILALSAGYQDKIKVQIDGPRAKTLLKKLKKMFANLNQYKSISIETVRFDLLKRQQEYGKLLDDRYSKKTLLSLTY